MNEWIVEHPNQQKEKPSGLKETFLIGKKSAKHDKNKIRLDNRNLKRHYNNMNTFKLPIKSQRKLIFIWAGTLSYSQFIITQNNPC